MNKLAERLKKNSTVKETSLLASTKFFSDKDNIPTAVPALNIALSGSLKNGFSSGLGQFCGPSKHFKSSFMLLLVGAFLKKYPDGVVLFYDTEFGSPPAYFKSFKIDLDRVIHTPITNIEKLKFDIMAQLDELTRDDKIMVIIDSIGNIASAKEVQDALDGKSAADMTRAKQLKSLFRMVTPILTMKDIPMVVVNHTYDSQETYSKQIVSGGTGSVYSSDWIVIVGKQQEKEGTDIIGYNFVLNIEKSRYVREKSKIPITVTYEGGIEKWSGLLDLALESGHVIKPSMGWYSRVTTSTGEVEEKKWRAKDTSCSEFWMPIITDPTFNEWIENRYKIANSDMISEDDEDAMIESSLIDSEDE